ncbi:MAG: ABC transporter substrate-binding protein [Acidimicrobiales bacterium]
MRQRWCRHVGFAVACALLAATGCGGASEEARARARGETVGNGANGTVAPAPLTGEVTDVDETFDASTEPPAGRLTIGVATDVATLDPHRASTDHSHFLSPVYDTLVQIGTDGTIIGGLAREWTTVDPTTIELDLEPQARFADGAPVDADAVVWSLERGAAIVESPSAGVFAAILSSTAVDDHTVSIRLTEPNVSFLRELAGPAGMIVNPAAGDADLARAPMGSGPFTFDRAGSIEGVEYRYTVRADYWGRSAGVEELVYSIFGDTTARVNSFLDGQVDIAAELGPIELGQLGERREDHQVARDPAHVPGPGRPRRQPSEPLGDPRFARRSRWPSIASASTALFQGGGIPTRSFWVDGSPYHSGDIVDLDLEDGQARARELLAEAGYPDGFSFTVPTIEPLRPFNEAVRGSLAAVGIDMKIELLQIGTMAGELQDGKWVGRLTVARGITPASFYADELASDAPLNPFDNDRRAYDALAAEALAAADENEAAATWAELYDLAVRDGALIPIGPVVSGAAAANHVEGAQMPPGALIPNPRNIRVDGDG